MVIDGVFMGMRKIPGIKFGERISGFHNYDQSILPLYRIKGYKVMVTNEILLEHFSSGTKDLSLDLSNRIFF